jgi:hypothetical protein
MHAVASLGWCCIGSSHNACACVFRCIDIDPMYRSKARFVRPLVVIPGPKEPANITPYVQGIMQSFHDYGPTGEDSGIVRAPRMYVKGVLMHVCMYSSFAGALPLMATERTVTEAGGISERTFQHKPLLASCTSDSPARCKMAKYCSHAATLGCGGCAMHGTNIDELSGRRSAMHFLGYSTEADGGLNVPGKPSLRGFCGDEVFKLSHQDHLERAGMVEQGEWNAQKAGCHGLSPIIQHLEYTRYDRVFACSVVHAMLLGLVKDFWGLLLCKVKQDNLPKHVRKLMAERARHMSSTLDQSRPYRCAVTQRGNWVMEDWLNWTEIWSVYIMSSEDQVCTLCVHMIGMVPVVGG